MGQLVIRIGTDGSLETLLKDKVLDTSKFGDRKITRITLIEFDEYVQKFYIKWLVGPFVIDTPVEHSYWHMRNALGTGPRDKAMNNEIVYFDTYELAVDHEVACVNALRIKGHKFDA